MYSFVDSTIQEEAGGKSLPAEALQLNGTYIENEIDGYRTLYVTGRELSESDITEIEIGNATGSEYQGKRNVQRSITVGYQLLSDSPESLMEKFNRLNGILDVEQARLIFRDEPDKYYIGTKNEVSDIPSGRINVTGEFTFYCCDPYKYSATEKTFDAALNESGEMEMVIKNEGTAPAVISYDITHNHENGFIGIVSEYGAMQYGKIEEVDTETLQKSQELFRYRNPTQFGAMTDGQGILTENFPKNGTWGSVDAEGKTWLAMSSSGSGSTWHGASKMVTIPQDSEGGSYAQNFYAQTKVWYETGRTNQVGLMEFVIGDENGQHLASIHLLKAAETVNEAYAVFQVQLKEKGRIKFTPSNRGVTTKDKGQLYIRKSGELFEFYFGGGKYSYRVPEAASKKAKTVTIFIGAYGSGKEQITRMYFDYLFFRKDNISYIHDIPNRYAAGSTMHIDGETGKMYLDGVDFTSDEIVGTKYFKAQPGETKVQFMYSNFSNPAPTIKAYIKEAWL